MTADPLTGIVIGAGDRGGHAYPSYLHKRPGEARMVAVAEPVAAHRNAFARRYGVPSEGLFEDYRDLLAQPRLADFALIATPDALHREPALLAMARGYHVLLEKPMAQRESECRELVAAAEQSDGILQVCHVLRYAPFFDTLKQIVASGELGDVVTIQHSENVSYWHYAHSYCRGSWRNSAESSPMILAKSCHDLDILYWLADADPVQLTSLARPTELCSKNQPEGAPAFCIDGCPHADRCPYDATAMYLDLRPLALDVAKTRQPRYTAALARLYQAHRDSLRRLPIPAVQKLARWDGWPISILTSDPSPEGVRAALRTTRYGRCVYQVGDNDQVSSQVVNVRFANGVNASFTMHSTSHREGREIRVDGTRGSAVGGFYNVEQVLEVSDHKTGRTRRIHFSTLREPHGGGDHRLFAGFLAAVRGEAQPATSASQSLQSHVMAFAADRAQREKIVVEFPEP
jgi:predicted dehydrogenase